MARCHRRVRVGNRFVPGSSFTRCITTCGSTSTARFRLLATVVCGCFTSGDISCTIIRYNVNNLRSSAGTFSRPRVTIVASITVSRVGFLNGALPRVTIRGTKVVGGGSIYILCPGPGYRSIFRGHYARANDQLVGVTSRNSFGLGGLGATRTTLSFLGIGVTPILPGLPTHARVLTSGIVMSNTRGRGKTGTLRGSLPRGGVATIINVVTSGSCSSCLHVVTPRYGGVVTAAPSGSHTLPTRELTRTTEGCYNSIYTISGPRGTLRLTHGSLRFLLIYNSFCLTHSLEGCLL